MTANSSSTVACIRVQVKRLLLLVVCLAAVCIQAACSTTEGFGKDVKHLGGGIENSAARNK